MGARQLLAVQTFDVARLTTHVVPIVPNTFIAVSGVGPRGDSNGSGKTSFLSAVSILLADPQWRLEANGGKFAAGILFKPDAAGVSRAQRIPAATYGYVVGVFAEPEDTIGTCLTVWIRIATAAPYVQARWISGLHVADADTYAERALQADSRWNALGSTSNISARRMSEELYGSAPRCLTYLDTPLRPAVPSLLSQQMTEMEPHDIGDSLIALAGLRVQLDDEEHQRATLLTNQRSLKEAEEQDAKARVDEEADLAGVSARKQAREALEQAERSWKLYVVRRYQEIVEQDSTLESEIAARAESVAEAEATTKAARLRLQQLRENDDLRTAERAAHQEWQQAASTGEALRLQRQGYVIRQGLLAQERGRLLLKAEGWSGAAINDAARDMDEARGQHAAAEAAREAAAAAITVAEHEFARAESGRGGLAGKAIDLLEQLEPAITAIGLFDELNLDAEARPAWEPRLWSWRHAVVVHQDDAERARIALAAIPGTQVVVSEHTDEPTALPRGIHSRVAVGQFLATLEIRLRYEGTPPHVDDNDLRLSVIGGFGLPITGREAVVLAARADVDAARTALSDAERVVATAKALMDLATHDHEAAVAAARLQEIAGEEEHLREQISRVDAELAPANKAEGDRQREWELANGLVQGYDKDVRVANLELAQAQNAERESRGRLGERQRARERLQTIAWHELLQKNGCDEVAVLVADSPDARRKPASLYRLAGEGLREALRLYGTDDEHTVATPSELRAAAELRDTFAEQDPNSPPIVSFEHVAGPLRIMLDGQVDNDLVIITRVEDVRGVREDAINALRREVAQAADRLEVVQDMIETQVEGILSRINEAFDRLDLTRGGFGAEVHFTSIRPSGPGPWRWEITPRWRRSPSGDLVPYREVANGAQVKVYAVQLVLAAVLADTDARGRVLVLDELGNSLGEVNRKDVLRALRTVADRQAITILGTCQDSVLADAADFCGELLWFTHSSATDYYNRPTRVWGFDPSSQRVELTADWIRTGREYA